MLPSRWFTDRLIMRDVAVEDAPRLLAVFNANAHIGVWDTTFQPIEQPEMDGLVAASLAQRNARGDPFQMQAICRRDGADGRRDCRLLPHRVRRAPARDPRDRHVCARSAGAESSAMAARCSPGSGRQLRALPAYQAAWARVWLKNWPALRMWVKAGFDRIVEIAGDKVLSAEGQANVILEQDLRRSL